VISDGADALGVANGRAAEFLNNEGHTNKLVALATGLRSAFGRIASVPTEKRARQKAARREKLEAQRRAAKRQKNIRTGVIVVVVAAFVITSVYLLVHSNSSKSTSTTTTSSTTTTTLPASAAQKAADAIAVAYGCPSSVTTTVNMPNWTTPPKYTLDVTKNYYATFKTTAGTFVEKLNNNTTKVNTNNFIFLAEHNYYKCSIFGRVITGFVDQGGYSNATTQGNVGYTVPADEYPAAAADPKKQYAYGDLAMANTGQAGSNGSQFFIVAGPSGEALPNSYTDFGQLVSGANVIAAINNQGSSGGTPSVYHRILNVTISNTK